MKSNKFISIISAAALVSGTASAFAPLTSSALSSKYDDKKYMKPVFEEFDQNLVNGTLVLTVPEDVTAQVYIYFASPEFDEAPYYSSTLTNGTYYFDIEGFDVSEDDYRDYFLRLNVSGGKFGLDATYFEGFTVPDLNDNPDSFKNMKYAVTVDGKEAPLPVEAEGELNKTIAFHLDYVKMGDIDGNSRTDASDASKILQEYSILSTGGTGNFNKKQKIAADVNGDGKINAGDASKVLVYYSLMSTGGDVTGIFADPIIPDEDETAEV